MRHYKEHKIILDDSAKSMASSSYFDEYCSGNDSTSDDDNEIDADEIKRLTAKIRRSNRVPRPVYDSFIDQQVIIQ